jgi:hypothetical protein
MGKGRTKVLHEPDCAVIRDVAESADEGGDGDAHVVPKCTCQKQRRERRKRSEKRGSVSESRACGLQDAADSLMNGNYRSYAGYYE